MVLSVALAVASRQAVAYSLVKELRADGPIFPLGPIQDPADGRHAGDHTGLRAAFPCVDTLQALELKVFANRSSVVENVVGA